MRPLIGHSVLLADQQEVEEEPWYKVVTPRNEVRAGRSFNLDEFSDQPITAGI